MASKKRKKRLTLKKKAELEQKLTSAKNTKHLMIILASVFGALGLILVALAIILI